MKSLGIIVTSFNNAHSITKCINSATDLLRRDLGIKIRILVVDDASEDGSIDLIKSFFDQKKIEKIHIFKKNGGVSRSRNFGIEYFIDADYLTFLDGDDELNEHIFNDKMTLKKSTDLFLYDYQNCFSGKNLTTVSNMPEPGYLTKISLLRYLKGYANQPNRKRLLTMCWGKVFSASLLKRNKEIRFNEKLQIYEDLDFVLRFLRKSNIIYYSKKVAYIYNVPNFTAQSSNSTFGVKWESFQLFSFFYSLRQLYFLLIELGTNKIVAERLVRHCSAAYISISTIRSFVRVTTYYEFLKMYLSLRRIFMRPRIKKSFLYYDVRSADGNFLLTFFFRRRLFFLLSIYSLFLAYWRYRRN